MGDARSHLAPQRIVFNREMLARAFGDRWSDADLDRAIALLSANDGRFPPGVRDMPSDLVRAIQRERVLVGMRIAVTEVGYQALTVQDVLAHAVISRPTFYIYFKDKEDCFLAAFDGAAQRMAAEVSCAAKAGDGNRLQRLRNGLGALLRFAAEEPEAARLALVEARASSMAGRRRHDELVDRLAAWIGGADGRDSADDWPSPAVAGGVAGGIETVLCGRLQRGEAADLESLLPSLLFFALLPYEGRETAAAAAVLD